MKQNGLTLVLALVVAAIAGYAVAVYYPPQGMRPQGCPCCPGGKCPGPKMRSQAECDCGYGCGCSEGGQCLKPTTCPNVWSVWSRSLN